MQRSMKEYMQLPAVSFYIILTCKYRITMTACCAQLTAKCIIVADTVSWHWKYICIPILICYYHLCIMRKHVIVYIITAYDDWYKKNVRLTLTKYRTLWQVSSNIIYAFFVIIKDCPFTPVFSRLIQDLGDQFATP